MENPSKVEGKNHGHHLAELHYIECGYKRRKFTMIFLYPERRLTKGIYMENPNQSLRQPLYMKNPNQSLRRASASRRPKSTFIRVLLNKNI
jgi:hypothetical protein